MNKGAFGAKALSRFEKKKRLSSRVIGKKWNKEQRGKTVSTGMGALLHISIEAHQVRSSITGLKWVRWQKNDRRKQRGRHIISYSQKKLKSLNILYIASSHITITLSQFQKIKQHHSLSHSTLSLSNKSITLFFL